MKKIGTYYILTSGEMAQINDLIGQLMEIGVISEEDLNPSKEQDDEASSKAHQ